MSKPFTVNVNRFDPYKNYRFLVYFGTPTPVAGVSKVTGLKRTTDVIEYKEGGNAAILKGMGRTKYDAITLERGVTHDDEFEKWANLVQVLDSGTPKSPLLGDRRKNISIVLKNEAGQDVMKFNVYRCWVSEYQALPDLDAGGNAVALQHVKIEHEGWERDPDVGEPNENP